jgi:hypothetical protein
MWITLFAVLGTLLFAVVLFNYVFSIYETKFDVTNQVLYADGASTATITATPINAWGFKAPFRKAHTKFVIEEGDDKVDIVVRDEDNGILTLRSKLFSGKIVVKATPAKSLFPTKIELEIFPNAAMDDSLAGQKARYMM